MLNVKQNSARLVDYEVKLCSYGTLYQYTQGWTCSSKKEGRIAGTALPYNPLSLDMVAMVL